MFEDKRVLWGVLLVSAGLGSGCTDATGVSGQEPDAGAPEVQAVVVDTGQDSCYDGLQEMTCPASGQPFYGQDAQTQSNLPAYRDNGDGTITDLNTGLMWTQSPDLDGDGDIDIDDKLSFADATAAGSQVKVGGYDDWRLPTIKELYSLMDFRGEDLVADMGTVPAEASPFLDTDYFEFGYGDTSAGERAIDAQFASSTQYVSTTMGGAATMFGVNFADGRIKGYPTGALPGRGEAKGFYVLFVRGESGYGVNDFRDNADGTVTDQATGLMWAQDDSGAGMDWQEALAWVQERNAEGYLGHGDWRLPNAKELQSIVDYSRAPGVTASPAIDPIFNTTAITNEAGQVDYPAFWSSTTHANLSRVPGGMAAYVCFGRCMGYMFGQWLDVHGAGAQRSDPKAGDPSDWPVGMGPQGDARRVDNFVRPVRDADGS